MWLKVSRTVLLLTISKCMLASSLSEKGSKEARRNAYLEGKKIDISNIFTLNVLGQM
jgi:hypothetical protein